MTRSRRALADDDGITEASDGDLGAAIRVAVGQLAAAGYFGDTTVLIAPEDLPAARILGDLPLLGVTAVIPSARAARGYRDHRRPRACVQVRYHGDGADQHDRLARRAIPDE